MPPEVLGAPTRRHWLSLARAAWPLLAAVALLVGVNVTGRWLTAGAGGYVAAESHRAKAQKEALHRLRAFVATGDPAEHDAFLEALRVPLGDRAAREALQRGPPERAPAVAGLLQGGSHPDDIAAMIDLFRWRELHPSIPRAIHAWAESDLRVAALTSIAAQAQALAAGPSLHARLERASLMAETARLEREITDLGVLFASEMGQAARDLGRWLNWFTAAAALLLVGLGGFQARRVLAQRESARASARRYGQRLALATLGANDGVWEWHLATNRIDWTPRVQELLGHPVDSDLHGDRLWRAVHPDEREALKDALSRHFLGVTGQLEHDCRLRCGDGEFRWFRLRGTAVRDDSGAPVRLLGTLSDIHSSVLAQQALKDAWSHSQQIAGELELALNGADVALWAFEPATGTILHHKRWDALLERTEMPRTFQGWIDLTHPDDRRQRLLLLQQHLDNQSAYYESEFRMLHARGHWVWVRSRGRATVRDAQGRALQYAGAVMNITAQVAAREVQRREQDFLRAMVEGVDVGVMIADHEHIQYANRRFARLVGYNHQDELTGMRLAQIMPPGELAKDLANRRKASAGGVIPMRVARLLQRGGATVRTVMNLSCVDWNGEPHFISTVSTASEHEELEAQLHAAADRYERALLSELEAQQTSIATELHDSLGSELAGVSLLLGNIRRRTTDPTLLQLLERCQTQVQASAEMTRSMARGIMPVGAQPGAFVEALEQFAQDLTFKGIHCDVEADGDFGQVQPEVGTQVYRVVQEAVANAIRHGEAKSIRIHAHQTPGHYILSIDDDGSGCDLHTIEATHPGMGLKSMRARARSIGATLRLQNLPTGGCRVSLMWSWAPRLHAPDPQRHALS